MSRTPEAWLRKALIGLLSCACCWMLLAVQAESPSDIQREEDERAATIEQRQALLTDLLARAAAHRASGDDLRAAEALVRAGRLQSRLHKPDEALSTFAEALTLARRARDSSVEVAALNGTAAIHAQSSRCNASQESLKRSVTLSEQTGFIAGKAEALLILSDCQSHTDHALALKTGQESLTLWQSAGSKWGIAKAYMAIGDYQFSQNDLIAATQSQTNAANIWTELNLPAEKAATLIKLGFIEYRRGAWQDSIVLLSQARTLIDEHAEPFRMGQIDGTIAEAFIEAGLPEVGLEKLKTASEYFRRANSPRAGVVMSWNIGRAHYMLGNYDEALKTLSKGVSDGQSLDEPIFGALCAEFLGRTHAAMSDSATALKHYSWALRQFRNGSKPLEAARTTALIGQLYQNQGRLNQAGLEYRQALAEFRRLGDQINESATLYALGTLELQQNNLGPAENYLRQSLAVTENIRRISTSNDLTAAFSATVQERYEGLIECLMRRSAIAPAQDSVVQAFETSELARARSLAEFFRATQAKVLGGGVEPVLADRESSLRQELRVKEDDKVKLLTTAYKPEQLAALNDQIQTLAADYKQIVATIRAKHPSYDQITEPPVWDLRRIQDQVIADDDTLLLEYSLGSEKSYVWAVTRTDIASYELASKGEIVAATTTVYELLNQPPGDSQTKLNDAIQKLSGLLVAPLAGKLKKRIIIVGDGALNYLPFQVLSAGNAEPLVANHVIVNAPSASILGYLEQQAARRVTRENAVAAFGDPIFAANFPQKRNGDSNAANLVPAGAERAVSTLRDIELSGDSINPDNIQPLFYAKRELAMLREISGDGSLIATGFDASREKLREADFRRYAILHFATHGILDPKRPENSGIFLSMFRPDRSPQDGYLSLPDIYNLRVPVDLVVLSACRTGLGKQVRGEGLIGLTRGFMYAGASSVVASLWKVDDEATAELMKRFYANMLQRQMKPAEALREAQNSIRSEPQWSSPYYWAAFTLQGEHRHGIKTHRARSDNPQLIAIAIGFSILAAALGFSYRRMRRALT